MKKNVLVVDDDISVTNLLQKELEECCDKMNVICQNSGYQALNRIMQGDIDLLLTDIAMPDMDGYQLYARAIEYDPELPVIMMTGFGYDPNHAVVKSKQHGLKDVVFKPFNIPKLVEKIKKRLE